MIRPFERSCLLHFFLVQKACVILEVINLLSNYCVVTKHSQFTKPQTFNDGLFFEGGAFVQVK